MSDEANNKQKEEISRQQHLYTAAVLTFMALVGNITKPLTTRLQFWIAAAMLTGAILLGIYMVIVCHKEYCARNEKTMGWWGALADSFLEHKGALFCNGLILIAGVGLITYLASGVESLAARTGEAATVEQNAAHEPPPTGSSSNPPVSRTLDSLPASSSGGGR